MYSFVFENSLVLHLFDILQIVLDLIDTIHWHYIYKVHIYSLLKVYYED